MAAMTTALTEFTTEGNSRSYTVAAHTALKPSLVLQRRKVASQPLQAAEDQLSVLVATVDADGNPITTRVMFTATVRRPLEAADADITAALATFRDLVASDEFSVMVSTQGWVA